MLLFLTCMMTIKFISCVEKSSVDYKWVEQNSYFDFIVGISISNVSVCGGVLIAEDAVLTTANPLVGYHKVDHYGTTNLLYQNIRVHVIYKEWDTSLAVKVQFSFAQYLSTGVNGYYSSRAQLEPFYEGCPYGPLHDLLVLSLETRVVGNSSHKFRTPFLVEESNKRIRIYPEGTFTVAGFAFVDEPHVKQNVHLEAADYEVEQVYVDCDEWIPRAWGYFICLLNIEHFVGIDSGASLLYNAEFIGLGAFSLARGNESILVFTDYRAYKHFEVKREKAGWFFGATYPNSSIWEFYP